MNSSINEIQEVEDKRREKITKINAIWLQQYMFQI